MLAMGRLRQLGECMTDRRNTVAEQFGYWGRVPSDGDVLPFSKVSPASGGEGHPKKKHHYISATYIAGWTADDGRVWAYRADEPADPHRSHPFSIGYRKHYYSQTNELGERDDHRWEDLWGCIETVWPPTLCAVRDKRLSPAISFNLLGMVAIMRARVPAARERHELLMAHKLRTEVKAAEALGVLPYDLKIYAGRLDEVPVGINPEQSLGSMREDFMESGDLAFRLGFEVLHNATDIPFLTSDNPVCVYDPREPAHARTPYRTAKKVELLFPLSARMMLRGSTGLAPTNRVVRHRSVSNKARVRQYNRTIAQFGYRLYIAQDRSCDALVMQYAQSVPTVAICVQGGGCEYSIVWDHCFGPRPRLSHYIDTPEKAARLAKEMEKESFIFDRDGAEE